MEIPELIHIPRYTQISMLIPGVSLVSRLLCGIDTKMSNFYMSDMWSVVYSQKLEMPFPFCSVGMNEALFIGKPLSGMEIWAQKEQYKAANYK